MPALQNPRHEKFAQLVATGIKQRPAYTEVYGTKGKCAEASSSGLAAKVKLRIAEIRAEAAKVAPTVPTPGEASTFLTIAEKRAFYASILRTPVSRIKANSPLCAAVKKTGRKTVEYRTLDKLKAARDDSELAGHIAQAEKGMTVNVGVQVNVMTEEARANLMQKKQAAIARRLAARN